MRRAMEPWQLTATAARARLQEGTLTAEALVRSCLERIAARETVVKAWISSTRRLPSPARGRSTRPMSAACCTACRSA
ncbi:hypothetical protein ACFQU2_09130 [Siccirubricoccus deserti]